MSSPITARRRAVPCTFAVLLAVLAGLVTLSTQRGAAHASDTAGHDHAKPTGLPTAARVAFHDQMRKLWEDHVTWTRLAIVTFADGSAGFGDRDAPAAEPDRHRQRDRALLRRRRRPGAEHAAAYSHHARGSPARGRQGGERYGL